MADDTRFQAQRGPDYSQAKPNAAPRPRRGAEDPLAELARLIGQEDPFADFSSGARARPRPAPQGDVRLPRVSERLEPRPDERRRDSFRTRPDTTEARTRTESGARDRYGRDQARGEAYPYGALPAARAERDPGRAAFPPRTSPRYEEQPQHAEHDERYEAEAVEEHEADYSNEADVDAEADVYRDPPRRRRWPYLVAGFVGLVVLGSSGVFAYRTIFGVVGAKQPPMIRADGGPNKVVPTEGGQKIFTDRVGGEKPTAVVPREESPIDIAARTGRPPATTGAVPPPATPTVPAPAPLAATPLAMPAAASSAEPRRVRTVTVRADGTVVADQRPAAARGATTQPGGQPLPLNSYVQQPEEEEEETATAPARTPAPAPRPPARPEPPSPWGSVQNSSGTTQVARAPTSTVQTQPAASAYVVQVSSQRSEAEAQSAWRALQAKHSALLGNQQAVIKRADLERGTFYRALVGRFSTHGEANELCQRLKAAGGECTVLRN